MGLIIRHFDVFFRRPQILIPNSSSLNILNSRIQLSIILLLVLYLDQLFSKKIFSAHIRRSNIVQESDKYFSAVLLITLTLSITVSIHFLLDCCVLYLLKRESNKDLSRKIGTNIFALYAPRRRVNSQGNTVNDASVDPIVVIPTCITRITLRI